MTVGWSFFVSVKVESCFGSHPICRTRLPSLEKATERFDEVVLLPIPPLPYTAKTFAPSIVRPTRTGDGTARCRHRRRDAAFGREESCTSCWVIGSPFVESFHAATWVLAGAADDAADADADGRTSITSTTFEAILELVTRLPQERREGGSSSGCQ